MDTKIWQLVLGIPTYPPRATTDDQPTLASILTAQRAMSDQLKHMSQGQSKINLHQRKFWEYEKKKKSKFLN